MMERRFKNSSSSNMLGYLKKQLIDRENLATETDGLKEHTLVLYFWRL
jgi:hypothetical protein